MHTWITHNLGTLLIGLVLLAAVAAIVVHLVRKKKRGASSCSCSCAGCPMQANCHKKG